MNRQVNRLGDLMEQLGGGCPLEGGGPRISDVHLDSRRVGVGNLFCALPGNRDDGARFVADAASRGAVAVLTPHELDLRTVTYDMPGLHMDQWVHPDARRVAGRAAALVHGEPCRDLAVAGITGTNGKTTTAHILGQLLERAGLTPAVLGTAGHTIAGGRRIDTNHTTPDAPDLQRLFRMHRDGGGRTVVMEVSSHALSQERTTGVEFEVAIFTNLTREHLDYHGDMERYVRAKTRLFEQLGSGSAAVINIDDPAWGVMATAARRGGARIVTYSTRSRADLCVSRLRTEPEGSYFVLSGMGIEWTETVLPLRGRYNVENALAACAAALVMGASPSAIADGLATTSAAPGRLERIPTGKRGFELYVDYAHSPDALERVLAVLREGLRGKLIVVFGCGGDRDSGKRPEMGRIAGAGADVAIVTSDNPRSEDPEVIIAEVVEGVREAASRGSVECIVQRDRELAIQRAIELATAGDVVLVAGKGHETSQVIGEEVISFDDRRVAQEALS
jgi:UDP-N-acetylmuramoyl-L-alanyl-D-glutamate--2,6-diaminopimelate ligase